MTIKAVHVSSVHPAGDPRITVKECGALAAAGYDVVFVCPHDRDDTVNGVRIRAIPKRRGRALRFVRATFDAWRAAVSERGDVYHLHDPELLPVGLLLRLTGAKVIYDAHEDLPRQMLAKPWIPSGLRRALSAGAEVVEGALSLGMNGIVAATPRIADRFRSRRAALVQNFAMAEELAVADVKPYRERPATFIYVGGIAEIRGVREMIEAIGRLPANMGARLSLAGLLSHDSLRDELEQAGGWERVDYHGWQTRRQIAARLHEARAGLLLLHPTVNYLESYPVKAFEYMSAGLPMIVSDFPLWRELFGDVGCALFVNPLDAEAIATAMRWVLEHPSEAEAMGVKGRAAVRARFNWQAEASKLLKFYELLVLGSNIPAVRARFGDA